MKTILPVLFLLFGLAGCNFRSQEADLVIHNAVIHTLDGNGATFEAMAVRDGRILELGAERQIMNRYAAKEVHDAAGSHVYPGFIDGHCHFFGYGLNKQKVDLVGVKSEAELVDRVIAHAAAHPGQEWLIGRGWDQNLWEGQRYPDNTALNAAFPDRPVFLQRIDGHAAVVNQAGLERVGLSAQSTIAGGLLEIRDGRLTGLLLDNAVEVFQKIFDEADEATKRKALLRAQEDCFRAGLTMVCDAGLDTNTIALIDRMQRSGELKMRVYAMVADRPEHLAHYATTGPIVQERLIVRAVKVYADGALGSRGALLKAPYSDVDSTWHGLQLASAEHFDEVAAWCMANGFQMATHCIGDSANKLLLDIYGKHLESGNDRRWRIEHAQVVEPSDLGLFRKWNVIPSVQPTHATSDMPWAADRLGPVRTSHAYAYKALLEQNGLVALGTDFPVEGIAPLGTFHAAVTRSPIQDPERTPVLPENALSRAEALRGLTIHNAIATFTEADLGTLEAGKLADVTIVDRDLETTPTPLLHGARVLATFVNGERVH